ncbi:MAG: aldehyde ferredoxin oxidoreductase family protein [Acidobacteriota bacterium]
MENIYGTNNRVLEIDLTLKKHKTIEISDKDRKKYLGGKGLALKLLYDRLKPGIDPLGEENIFIITTGVLIGTGAPNSARFSAISKSPMTGIITHSSCGGPFGNALKTSGWDGLILKGRSDSPVFLNIDSKGVTFESAEKLLGKTTSETEKHLLVHGKGALCIGPAGENLVRYANIYSGDRYLGRGGLGTVLGSKKIKGIVAKGEEYSIKPKDKKNFKKYSSRGFKLIKRNYYTNHEYRNYGTLMHLCHNNRAEIFPVNNFSRLSSTHAEKLSGEFIKETRNTGFKSCSNCTILCGHEGDFNGKRTSVPEYETASLLGSNLGIFDIDKISEWNDICGEMGIDTISAGGTIGFVMEASEKGLMDSPLRFGKVDHISETLKDIANMRGMGKKLAMGSAKLAEIYGGKEFNMTVKGLEMGGYDPRGSVGMGLNYAVANRGACHLSSALFGMETVLGLLNPHSAFQKAVWVKYLENIISGINSLHTCQFTIYPYILESLRLRYLPKFIIKIFLTSFPAIAKLFFDMGIYSGLFSSVTGIRISKGDFLRAGNRTHTLERFMNTREGVTAENDTLPERILSGRVNGNSNSGFPLEKMKKKYYKIRKYDNNGIPRRSTLEHLGIDRDGKVNRT